MRQSDFSSAVSKEAALRLGARIRIARKYKGWTLQELEGRCGVHRTTLSRLEAGELGTSIGVLVAVLQALNRLSDLEFVLERPGRA